jgi:hypothetical protein
MHTPAHKQRMPQTLAETFDQDDLYPVSPSDLFGKMRSLEGHVARLTRELAAITKERDELRFRLAGLDK